LTKIKEKFCLFVGKKAGMRRKGRYFGSAPIGSIVFDAMIKKKDPLLNGFHWVSPLISPLPVFCSKSWRKRRCRGSLPGETIMVKGSFGSAPSGSIILDAEAEKNKPLLDTIHWYSQS